MVTTLEAYKTTGKAIGWFIVGYLASLALYYIIPPILTVFTDGDVSAMATFFTVLLWIFFLILLPLYKSIEGIRSITPENKNSLIGILWFVLTWAVLYFGYYMIGVLAGNIDNVFLLGTFYVGSVLIILTHGIAIPYISIFKGTT